MNIALWILQATLAAILLTAGLDKHIQPKEKLETKMGWVHDFTPGSVSQPPGTQSWSHSA